MNPTLTLTLWGLPGEAGLDKREEGVGFHTQSVALTSATSLDSSSSSSSGDSAAACFAFLPRRLPRLRGRRFGGWPCFSLAAFAFAFAFSSSVRSRSCVCLRSAGGG